MYAIRSYYEIFCPRRFERLSIALYLALGWAGLFAAGAIVRALPVAALVLILVGGVLYSVGVVFRNNFV